MCHLNMCVECFILFHRLTICILETPKTDTLANSEGPGAMQHNAAFHRSLHILLRLKKPLGIEIHHTFNTSTGL